MEVEEGAVSGVRGGGEVDRGEEGVEVGRGEGVVGVDAEEVVEKVEAGWRGGVVVDEVEVKERAKEEGSRGRNTLAQLTKKITRYN